MQTCLMERRSNARFPIKMTVRYRTVGERLSTWGVGRTLNMSSRGLLIASAQKTVRTGVRLEIALEWPPLLQGSVPLQLLAGGCVVRCQESCFAVRLVRCQFHTRKRARRDLTATLAAGA